MSLDKILHGTENEQAKQEQIQLTAKYRIVFNSEMGAEVLNDILREAGHGRPIGDMSDVQRGAYDLGTTILYKIGVYIHETRQAVTNALLNIQPQEE